MSAAVQGAIVGYARVSTGTQDPALQQRALSGAGAIRVFTETASGVTKNRPALRAALDFRRPGDVLAWRLDRLGRSLPDLIAQVQELDDAGIGFWSLTEAIDTTTTGGRLVFHIFGALAEFERQLIRERTSAGLAAARANGQKFGRPTVMTEQRTREAARMRAEEMILEAIAEVLGVGRSSVARALARPVDGPTDS